MDRRLGKYLKTVREDYSMSLNKLADLTNLKVNHLLRIEAGTQLPGRKTINSILDVIKPSSYIKSMALELYKDAMDSCRALTYKEDTVLSLFQNGSRSLLDVDDIIFLTDYSRAQVSAVLRCLKAKGLIKKEGNGFKKVEG